jgi:hypothetical protein
VQKRKERIYLREAMEIHEKIKDSFVSVDEENADSFASVDGEDSTDEENVPREEDASVLDRSQGAFSEASA